MAVVDWFIYAVAAGVAAFTALTLLSGIAMRRRIRMLSWLRREVWLLLVKILGAGLTNIALATGALFVLEGSSPQLGLPNAPWFATVLAGSLGVSAMIGLASGLIAVTAPRSLWLKRLVPSFLLIATVISCVPALALVLAWGLGRQTLDWLYAELLLLMGPLAFWYAFRASSQAHLEPW